MSSGSYLRYLFPSGERGQELRGSSPSMKGEHVWCSPFSSVKRTVVPFIFSGMISFGEGWDPQERAEILLQSLPDSYDQVIINLTSNVLTDCLVFDDVAASTLKEENRRNNREGLTKTSSRRGGSFGGVMRGEVNGTWLLGGVTIMVKSKTGKSHVQVGKQLCLWNCTTFAILSSYRGGRAVNSSRTHDIQMRSFWIRKARQEEIEAYP
ncbi:hypothetical protein Tco_0318363 [Tanacetum coccineum]